MSRACIPWFHFHNDVLDAQVFRREDQIRSEHLRNRYFWSRRVPSCSWAKQWKYNEIFPCFFRFHYRLVWLQFSYTLYSCKLLVKACFTFRWLCFVRTSWRALKSTEERAASSLLRFRQRSPRRGAKKEQKHLSGPMNQVSEYFCIAIKRGGWTNLQSVLFAQLVAELTWG